MDFQCSLKFPSVISLGDRQMVNWNNRLTAVDLASNILFPIIKIAIGPELAQVRKLI